MLKFNTNLISPGNLNKVAKKFFSHGPFNPTNYRYKSVGTRRLTYNQY